MEQSFNGKVALVTGAGKGIGRAVAKRLSELGARTVALSRTKEDLDTLKSENPDIDVHRIDLCNWDETRSLVEKLGCVDLLVNNAGVAWHIPFLEMTKETIDEIFDVNFKAVYNVTQVVAKSMIEKGVPGSIVNISSLGSTKAYKGESVYSSSKAALDMLTKSMALELGPYKIRVNSVNPTIVLTQMGLKLWSDPQKAAPILKNIPLGRFVEVEDVVSSVVFLLSDQSKMINGSHLAIDGGQSTH